MTDDLFRRVALDREFRGGRIPFRFGGGVIEQEPARLPAPEPLIRTAAR